MEHHQGQGPDENSTVNRTRRRGRKKGSSLASGLIGFYILETGGEVIVIIVHIRYIKKEV